MPVSAGRWLNNSANASSPPAEAPIPTISRGPPAVSSPAVSATGTTAASDGRTVGVLVIGGVFRLDGRADNGGGCAPPPRCRPPVIVATPTHHFFLACLGRRHHAS